ncbi:MAG: ABC transporter permease, partial [Eubacterium sp.]|nr:ABC transporter permease [Eubacterium sp.]
MNQTQKKTEYILRKTGQMLLVLFLLSVIVFTLARLCPGDPLRAYYGDGLDRMNEQQKELARDKLGLN